MNTEIIQIQNNRISDEQLRRISDILMAGGLVVFPTETVYGLGGDGTSAMAAQRIYRAKGRPSDNPLILHLASPEQAEAFAHTNETYYRLARAFMPGPLTIILPKKDTVPDSVTGGLDTVALRCPSHPVARSIIQAFGRPIAAPSANLSGRPSPTCAKYVIEDLSGRVDMIVDGGDCEIGLESTIIKLDGTKSTLLRPGAITQDALLCVCTEVAIAPSVLEQLSPDARPESPGMKYRHYAPDTPLVLLDGDPADVVTFLQRERSIHTCSVLGYSEELSMLGKDNVIDIGSANAPEVQARRLFTALREADRPEVDVIYAHLPPKEGIGLALYNRMIRAAAHTIRKV